MNTTLIYDQTMGGAQALQNAALRLTNEEWDKLITRINELVAERHDDAILRRDVEQALDELYR